jgi:lipopolysaccharide transport system ATP-binding protein
MATPIIKIENLSKIYRLGQIGTGTLRDDYKRWIYKIRGKEDPFLKIGEANDRNKKGNSDYIYALKNINLEVMPGEILGIIGKNGAGKSSLLKILSKVTGPTTGSISYNGRIGSLLEVGTGFHPELTGRENVFLNGAILGMTKTEIKSKFDEIVDFSGVERYIDTPVKRYSSGMMVRLGFAVAAHLEPEILVVDEVLAVGDAEFQKKAIGKMKDVSKNDGRTVLFVSHNMASIKGLCNKSLVFDKGQISFYGEVQEGIEKYLTIDEVKSNNILDSISFCHHDLQINSFKVNNSNESIVKIKDGETILNVEIKGSLKISKKMAIEILLIDSNNNIIASYHPSLYYGKLLKYNAGSFVIIENIQLPNNLIKGSYFTKVTLTHPMMEVYMEAPKCFTLDVEGLNPSTVCNMTYNDAGFVLLTSAKEWPINSLAD